MYPTVGRPHGSRIGMNPDTAPRIAGMSNSLRFRLAMLGAVAAILVVALAIRAVAPIGGPVEQSSGTALYASMIYAGVLVLWPRLGPLATGAIALGWCWGAELFQLTGVP